MDDVFSSWSSDSMLELQPAEHPIHCERCRGLTRVLNQADDGICPSGSLLVIWKEFRHAPVGTMPFVILMFIGYSSGLVLIGLATL
jgi:hypothetical protein